MGPAESQHPRGCQRATEAVAEGGLEIGSVRLRVDARPEGVHELKGIGLAFDA